ncbi:MAG: hypothetical protein SGI77_21845 [Pirellulaceae bacterium]|nr:hypothetical protein [Pirellulaceae bacterium]
MKNRKFSRLRCGMASMDVVFIIGTLFPICMVLYYIAEQCLANLYEMISVIIGCPVM